MDTPVEQQWREGELEQPLKTARAYPAWSSLSAKKPQQDLQRTEEIERLADSLAKQQLIAEQS